MVDTIPFTGAADTFTVPTTGWWQVTAWGGQGGNFVSYPGTQDAPGGLGGSVAGLAYLTAGTVIDVWVGGCGGDSGAATGTGGWSKSGYHGGACGSPFPQAGHAAGGGGATIVETPSGLLLVVGGGGGAGIRVAADPGGAGGGGGGAASTASGTGGTGGSARGGTGGSHGGAGTGGTSAGGTNASDGSAGQGGQGGFWASNGAGGGGGGGYYGGGGGGADSGASSFSSGGGGGGATWWDAAVTAAATAPGTHTGDGVVTIELIAAAGGWSVGFKF